MDNGLKVSKERKCSFQKKDNNGELLCCELRSLEDDVYCIFHSENVAKKTKHFDSAFNRLIEQIDKNRKLVEYNFRGFIFPKINLKHRLFKKMVDIRWATFSDMADFENAFFKNGLFAHKTIFKGIAFFQGAKFKNNVSFVGAEFNKLILIGDTIENKISFHGCKFYENAVFQGRCFLDDVIFQSSIFFKDVDFQRTEFHKKLDFSNSDFRGKVSFLDAKLLDEVVFNKTKIASLKNIKGSGINLDGAVLLSTNFRDSTNFHNYSFKNSVLISCDFSNKSLINCDFTGAVLKSIHSDNITIDSKTCAKTRFIYTDYEEIQEAGITRIIPKNNSRFPIAGDFGDKDNANFTLIDYFQQFHKWNFLLDLPIEVRTGILNYINFFKDYIRSTEDINVDIATEPLGDRSKISILTKAETKKDIIALAFQNYIENIFKSFEQISTEFRNDRLTTIQKESFIANYRDEHIVIQKRIWCGLIDESNRNNTALEMARLQIADLKRDKAWFQNEMRQLLQSPHAPININVQIASNQNQEMTATIDNNIQVGIELARLSDELNNIRSEAHQADIDYLKEEIKNILNDQKEKKNSEQIKSRTKTFLGALGKTANYGIQNFDKIINIGNAIAKMLGINPPNSM